jgi:solute carrier family 35 protein E3
VSFCAFVLLTNYSLEYNSIGTYQCLKALTIPGVMIISILFYKQNYSMKVKFSVVNVADAAVFGLLVAEINLRNFK